MNKTGDILIILFDSIFVMTVTQALAIKKKNTQMRPY